MKPGFALDKRTLLVSVPLCLALCALVNLAGYLLDCRYVSIPAAIAQANDYEVRSRLLMEAMEKAGVCEPEDAALVWASGLDMRSAALQYAVMDAQLKAEYARQLEETSPNWVTGMSSPWIESYSIEKIKRPGRDSRIIRLVFSTASSTGRTHTIWLRSQSFEMIASGASRKSRRTRVFIRTWASGRNNVPSPPLISSLYKLLQIH